MPESIFSQTISAQEFLVNTYSVGNQQRPSLSSLSDGNFVSIWDSVGQDGNGYGVFGQIFDSSGTKVGSEFQVNTYTNSSQGGGDSSEQNGEQSICALAEGGFVVVWRSHGQNGDVSGVYAQKFNNDGSRDGSEFEISSLSDSSQTLPRVSALTSGGFAVTWATNEGGARGVNVQTFDSAGVPEILSPIVVESATGFTLISDPVISALLEGGFAVTYEKYRSGTNSIITSFFDADGSFLKSGVNVSGGGFSSWPSTSLLSAGNLLVCWNSNNGDGDDRGVFGKIFDASGNVLVEKFQVNSFYYNSQADPAVAALDDGGFIVSWTSSGQGEPYKSAIFAQRFDEHGNKVGEEFRVNTQNAGHEMHSSITITTEGKVVFSWDTNDSTQDGDGTSVKAKIFDLQDVGFAPDQMMEFFARDIAYRAGQGNDDALKGKQVLAPNHSTDLNDDIDTGYVVDEVFKTDSGFVAVGLTSENGDPPVIAIRGTNSVFDFLADLEPAGIGATQVLDAWNDTSIGNLKSWILGHANEGVQIVGHSLGGAQAQLLAAFATEAGINVGSVTTYNSPGISSVDKDRFDASNLTGSITHHISSGDLVSMAGHSYLSGTVEIYDLDTIQIHKPWTLLTHFLVAHVDQWSDPDLYDSIFHGPDSADWASAPVSKGQITTEELESGLYSHLFSNNGFDAEYFGFLLTLASFDGELARTLNPADQVQHQDQAIRIAWALTSRERTEDYRQDIGEFLQSLLDAGDAYLDFTQAIGPAVSAAMNAAIVTTVGGAEFIAQLAIESWGTLAEWSASQWETVSDWTVEKWQDLTSFAISNLEATTQKAGAALLRLIDAAWETGETVSDDMIAAWSSKTVSGGGSVAADVIAGSGMNEKFQLGLGNDRVNPGGGFDEVQLGAGSDVVWGLASELNGTQIFDFTGQDKLIFKSSLFGKSDVKFTKGSAILDIDTDGDGKADTTVVFEGDFQANDIVVTTKAGNTIITTKNSSVGISQAGTRKADKIKGSPGEDVIHGGRGNDILMGGGRGDILKGGNGNDKLAGGNGDDVLFGGSGRDMLFFGKGADAGSGNGGSDTFVLGAKDGRKNVVSDFQNGSDKLDLTSFHYKNTKTALKHFNDAGGRSNNKVIFQDDHSKFTIVGIDLKQLDSNDILI